MNKYIYAEATQDYWPQIKSFSAKSYSDAIDKLINKYGNELDDDEIFNIDIFDVLRDYLNEKYSIALSDIEMYEEL